MSHARLAPSASARWVACPPSVALSDGIEDKTSVHAARGTAKHQAAELILRQKCRRVEELPRAWDIPGYDVTIELDDEDLRHVADYVDYVHAHQRHDRVGLGDLLIEQRLDLSGFIPESKGTADAVLLFPASHAEVIDAKFGSGVRVRADATQLACYALGVWDKYAHDYLLESVTVHVAQPPLRHYESHTYTAEQLAELRETIGAAAQLAHKGGGEFRAGDHCRWCPAKLKCPEMRKLAHDAAEQMFKPIRGRKLEAPDYDGEELAEFLELRGALKAWLSAVEDQAKQMLEQGHEVPGYKLVEGRRTRAWRDEKALVRYLRKRKIKLVEIYESVLRSPAKLEKELSGGRGKIDLDSHIEWRPGGLTIAPDSDKRPAVSSGAELAFTNVTNETETDE